MKNSANLEGPLYWQVSVVTAFCCWTEGFDFFLGHTQKCLQIFNHEQTDTGLAAQLKLTWLYPAYFYGSYGSNSKIHFPVPSSIIKSCSGKIKLRRLCAHVPFLPFHLAGALESEEVDAALAISEDSSLCLIPWLPQPMWAHRGELWGVASAQMTVSSGSLHLLFTLHLPKAYGKSDVDFVYHFMLEKQIRFFPSHCLSTSHKSVTKRNYPMHYFGVEILKSIF